ncbi:hypothetical protein BDR03DRAFT_959481 [Suillus americanus]|nr:hypothetical protein BDR03DRAFT_959481 [Suillus americanus]
MCLYLLPRPRSSSSCICGVRFSIVALFCLFSWPSTSVPLLRKHRVVIYSGGVIDVLAPASIIVHDAEATEEIIKLPQRGTKTEINHDSPPTGSLDMFVIAIKYTRSFSRVRHRSRMRITNAFPPKRSPSSNPVHPNP